MRAETKARIFFSVLSLSFFVLFSAQTVNACVCGSSDTTDLGKFEQSRYVIIAKAISVEPVLKVIPSNNSRANGTGNVETDIKTTRMVVEKVYKGDLEIGDDLFFGQGERNSCFWTFNEEAVGKRFLFYLSPKIIKPSIWFAEGCKRSAAIPDASFTYVERSADDLLYLDNIDRARGKTRVSGTIFAYMTSPFKGRSNTYRRFSNVRVHIIGEGRSFETTTNHDGVYEIYELPPGKYTIRPEVPINWKIDIWGGYTQNSSGNRWDHENQRITLLEGRHSYYDFHLELVNKIRGKVLGPSGLPIPDVCAQLIPAFGEPREDFVRSRTGCTKADGSFEITEVPPGTFKAVINRENKISGRHPFNTIYYPNMSQPESATNITVADAEDKDGIDFHVSYTKEVVTISGTFLTLDGVPVVYGGVFFEAANTDDSVDGSVFVRTDKNGRFSTQILKGLRGKLSGTVVINESQYANCPHIIEMIDENSNIGRKEGKTNSIDILAKESTDNLTLRLPFPSCEGEKIVSRIRID